SVLAGGSTAVRESPVGRGVRSATRRRRCSASIRSTEGGLAMTDHVLEPAAQQLVDATSQPPFLYELAPDVARKVLDDIQAAPIDKPEIEEKWITVPAAVGDVRVRIVKPVDTDGRQLPTVLYVHGGGWVLGNADTHDRLVRELAVGVPAAV